MQYKPISMESMDHETKAKFRQHVQSIMHSVE